MILKKTDLQATRDANMRIVKNKDGDYTATDISRASRIICQLAQLELKLGDKTPPEKHVERTQPVFDGEPLIYTLDHVRKNVS